MQLLIRIKAPQSMNQSENINNQIYHYDKQRRNLTGGLN